MRQNQIVDSPQNRYNPAMGQNSEHPGEPIGHMVARQRMSRFATRRNIWACIILTTLFFGGAILAGYLLARQSLKDIDKIGPAFGSVGNSIGHSFDMFTQSNGTTRPESQPSTDRTTTSSDPSK